MSPNRAFGILFRDHLEWWNKWDGISDVHELCMLAVRVGSLTGRVQPSFLADFLQDVLHATAAAYSWRN
jgi:hypothetical protein